jgi:NDP-sugar pyrophosphorylase family protein
MLDLKELLIMLGLAVGGPMPNQDMTFYRQKLSNEIVMEHKLQSEIKALEYRKMWDDVNKTEKTDFASNWLQEKKTDDKLTKHKKDLITTKKKITVLKQIIEKDSLEHIKVEPIVL